MFIFPSFLDGLIIGTTVPEALVDQAALAGQADSDQAALVEVVPAAAVPGVVVASAASVVLVVLVAAASAAAASVASAAAAHGAVVPGAEERPIISG
jgi:uncharacterized protein with LGFP repeats